MRRAVAEGLVRASRRGPRRTHVEVRERAYLARTWPLLSRLRIALRTEPNVRLAVLYGSVARGDDGRDSDVDILVARGDDDRARLDELQERLALRVERDVQLLALSDAERDPPLLAEILRDGRVLVDRDRRWPALVRREPALRRRAESELRTRAARALERIASM